jgi:hypothetical protein
MIYLVMNGKKLIILEPGNVEHIRGGGIATTSDKSTAIAYAPDHVWLQEQVMKIGGDKITPDDLVRLLKEGLSRPEVIERPFHPTWDAAKKGGTA